MKLAASQIGWAPEDQPAVLALLQGLGFAGIEIAPTMVLGPDPYEKPAEAAVFAAEVQEKYGLAICSLQSIWFGLAGSIFGPERAYLMEYTKAAMRTAAAMGAKNLVFGCPKNRVMPDNMGDESAVLFFRTLAEYAVERGCVLALEPNPPVYGTNFMNTTKEALAMVRRVNHPGCKLNLDVGTMIINGENANQLRGRVAEIHHVHISEPALAAIEKRELHRELAALLAEENYSGYVSIEMKSRPREDVGRIAAYVAEVFA